MDLAIRTIKGSGTDPGNSAGGPAAPTWAPVPPTHVPIDLQRTPDDRFSGSCDLYSVEHNRITILSTDAAAHRLPSGYPLEKVVESDGSANYYERQELSSKCSRSWRKIIGRFLAVKMFGRVSDDSGNDPKIWILKEFPLHYTLWRHIKTADQRRSRQDVLLYGTTEVTNFASPYEFILHAEWLMKGKPYSPGPKPKPQCGCKYCSGRKQQVITQELRDLERDLIRYQHARTGNPSTQY
ncbi:hypothetical protein BV25DRAFT_1194841 [Artomyces pyxidatus]|uniref:Uncharacterized protein n=1 Tax=Artomyces pyxidatus TaxID=48021 RepID=A0ACB8SRA6_9AGAM|nr:hypothetical protein BV25DRAFT_1194841 [Artomyces pyxidatus]